MKTTPGGAGGKIAVSSVIVRMNRQNPHENSAISYKQF
jgi:hypothetical protein